MKSAKKSPPAPPARRRSTPDMAGPDLESSFVEVIALIQHARQRAFQTVNTVLVELYWRIGEYISRKLETG